MSNVTRKMRKAARKLHESMRLVATQSMVYECERCGESWRMYLQRGLEDQSKAQKPVPFCIRCHCCGGTARHVRWFLDEKYVPAIPIDDTMNYFANDPRVDCGVPVMRQKGGMK